MGAVLSCCGLGRHIEINERKCTFVRRLGDGGFSVVDLVRDSTTGIQYALKRVTCMDTMEGCANVPSILTIKEARAQREADRYKLFNHPNIIPIVDSAFVPSLTQPGARDFLMLFPAFEVRPCIHPVSSF